MSTSKGIGRKNQGTSRRDFIKTAAVAAGAAGALSACDSAATLRSTAESKGLRIQMAGYDFDRVAALIDGRVPIEGAEVSFEVSSVGEMNVHVFSGPQTREVTEIGLHPFMLAYANDGFRDYSLIPVFPLRTFRHKSVFVRTDRGIKGPQDLRGKKIATPGYSSSSLTWIRGTFKEEYGLEPRDVEWIVTSKASAGGKASKQENILPKGVSISEGPEGQRRIRPTSRRRRGCSVPCRRAAGVYGRQSNCRAALSGLPQGGTRVLREDRHLSDHALGCHPE